MDRLLLHEKVRAAVRAARMLEAAEGAEQIQHAARLALAQQPGDAELLGHLAQADTLAAYVARQSGRLDDALRHANAAIEAATTIGDAHGACGARSERAHVLADLGFPEEALDDAYAALGSAKGDKASEAQALNALAAVQWSMGLLEDAGATYRRLWDSALTRADGDLESLALTGLAGIEHLLGSRAHDEQRDDEARARWQQSSELAARAASLAEQAHDAQRLYTARHNRAVSLMALGQRELARTELTQLLASPQEGQDEGRRALTLKNLADIDDQEGHHQAAVDGYGKALETLERLGQLPYATDCCAALADAYEALGDLAAALRYQRRFHDLYVRVASQAAQQRASAMAVKYKTEQVQAIAHQEQQRAEQLEQAHDQLRIEAARLARASEEDALTGLANRRRFDEVLGTALAQRGSSAFSLAILDIDHFKAVNDRFSHLAGDVVLQRVAAILKQGVRRGDLAARYGGEEFALVLAGSDTAAAQTACERIRAAIEAAPWADIGPGLAVTASIGLAHSVELGPVGDAQMILKIADARLYAAKSGGRNRVVAG